jgi:hypothetical protein
VPAKENYAGFCSWMLRSAPLRTGPRITRTYAFPDSGMPTDPVSIPIRHCSDIGSIGVLYRWSCLNGRAGLGNGGDPRLGTGFAHRYPGAVAPGWRVVPAGTALRNCGNRPRGRRAGPDGSPGSLPASRQARLSSCREPRPRQPALPRARTRTHTLNIRRSANIRSVSCGFKIYLKLRYHVTGRSARCRVVSSAASGSGRQGRSAAMAAVVA